MLWAIKTLRINQSDAQTFDLLYFNVFSPWFDAFALCKQILCLTKLIADERFAKTDVSEDEDILKPRSPMLLVDYLF